MSAASAIRLVGDPVLRRRTEEVTDIDGALVQLAQEMFVAMYDAPGIGLAANQVGEGHRMFVYDLDHGDGQHVLVNPVVAETDGEVAYYEGCLSVPGLHFDIVRPARVLVKGLDLDGNEVEFEAEDLLGRLVQHEMDHLNGVLLLDHLDDDQRKEAKRTLRRLQMGTARPQAEESAGSRKLFRFR